MVVTDFLAAHVFQYSFYLLSTNTKQSAAAVSHAAGPEMLDAGPAGSPSQIAHTFPRHSSLSASNKHRAGRVLSFFF